MVVLIMMAKRYQLKMKYTLNCGHKVIMTQWNFVNVFLKFDGINWFYCCPICQQRFIYNTSLSYILYNKKEKEQNMSIKELEGKGTTFESGDRIDIRNLPDKVKAKVVDYEFKEDTFKQECLYVEFESDEGKGFTQKYTRTMYGKLAAALKELGKKSISDLNDKFYTFKMTSMGRGFPRYLPIKVD